MKKILKEYLWLLLVVAVTTVLLTGLLFLQGVAEEKTTVWPNQGSPQLNPVVSGVKNQDSLHAVGFFSSVWETIKKVFTLGWAGAQTLWSGAKVVLSSLEFLLKPLFAVFRGLKWVTELF